MKYFLFLLSFICLTVHASGSIKAKSYVVTDLTGNVILAKNENAIRPIASLTKLLVSEQLIGKVNDLRVVNIEHADLPKRTSKVRYGMHFTERQLLELSLVPSNNQAIYALSRMYNTTDIVNAVNSTAYHRGLSSIKIVEPSGLSNENRSSALDFAKFISYVYNSDLANVSVLTNVDTPYHNFNSTNPFLKNKNWNFLLSKTGLTSAAGGCVAVVTIINSKPMIVVILGSLNEHTRWADLVKIKNLLENK